jgi:6-pyruvoyltetrahydropterin/6-carboxytetrahydropterin synthase
MFRLTREIRFAINPEPDAQLAAKPTNGHGGYPSPTGLNPYFTLRVTLAGELSPVTQYLRNIKHIDEAVRQRGIAVIADGVYQRAGFFPVMSKLFDQLKDCWPGTAVESLELAVNPYLSIAAKASEHPMMRLSQKFEFSAAHRLNNPAITDEQNRAAFGKCSNPLGHGHNYELQVTLRGEPDRNGVLIEIPDFEQIVADAVIDKLDHKFLNLEVPEFRETIPSVENIARVTYQMLRPRFGEKLASVTVWETPKTWCEYSE